MPPESSDNSAETVTVRPRRAYAKTAARKAQIVDAATAVFAASGYTGGSLREIADQIGVSLTSLVHHFPRKIELLEAVLLRANEVYGGNFDELCQAKGIRAAVLQVAECNFDHPELLRLLAILSAECSRQDHPGYAWFADRYAQVRQDYIRRVTYDQSVGRLPTHHDPAIIADLIVGIWDGLQLQWLIDEKRNMIKALSAFFDSIEARP